MSEEKIIKIGIEGDDIVIRLSKDHLIYLTENYPEAKFKVINKERYIEQFVENLKEYSTQSETGCNAIEDVFDSVINETYEGDRYESIIDEYDKWIEYIRWPDNMSHMPEDEDES